METIQSIGLLDILFIAILVISVLVGLIRGAVREILSLVGLIVAVYLAFTFSDMVSRDYVSRFFESPKVSYIVSFILIIIAAIFAIALINLLFSQLLRASGLSFVNRFFGMIFGVIRGTVISSIIALVLNFIPGLTDKTWYKNSAMAPIFRSIANQAIAYLPKEINDYLDSTKKTVGNVTADVIGSAVKKGTQQTTNNATSDSKDKGQRVTPIPRNSSSDKTKSQAIQLETATPDDDGLILESTQ